MDYNQVNVIAGGERFIEDKYSASLNKHETRLASAGATFTSWNNLNCKVKFRPRFPGTPRL